MRILDLAISVFHDLNRISQSTLCTPAGQTCAVSSSPIQPPLHSLPKAKVANCPAVIFNTNNICFCTYEKRPSFQYLTTFLAKDSLNVNKSNYRQCTYLYIFISCNVQECMKSVPEQIMLKSIEHTVTYRLFHGELHFVLVCR